MASLNYAKARKKQKKRPQEGLQKPKSKPKPKRQQEPPSPPNPRLRFKHLAQQTGLRFKQEKGRFLLIVSDMTHIINALKKKYNQSYVTKLQADQSFAELFIAAVSLASEADELGVVVFWMKAAQLVGWTKGMPAYTVFKLVSKILQARKEFTYKNVNGISSQSAIGCTVRAIDEFLNKMEKCHSNNILLVTFYDNPTLLLESDDEEDDIEEQQPAVLRSPKKPAVKLSLTDHSNSDPDEKPKKRIYVKLILSKYPKIPVKPDENVMQGVEKTPDGDVTYTDVKITEATTPTTTTTDMSKPGALATSDWMKTSPEPEEATKHVAFHDWASLIGTMVCQLV